MPLSLFFLNMKTRVEYLTLTHLSIHCCQQTQSLFPSENLSFNITVFTSQHTRVWFRGQVYRLQKWDDSEGDEGQEGRWPLLSSPRLHFLCLFFEGLAVAGPLPDDTQWAPFTLCPPSDAASKPHGGPICRLYCHGLLAAVGESGPSAVASRIGHRSQRVRLDNYPPLRRRIHYRPIARERQNPPDHSCHAPS